MSAYGALSRLARPDNRLMPTTAWAHPRDPHATVTLFHIDPSSIARSEGAGSHPGLFDHLHAVFADEVDRGLTYPQEDMRDPEAFRVYFFAADVVVAIADGAASDSGSGLQDGREVQVDLDCVRAGRTWDTCVVGFYYIKPNYPGRSSHVCNAGFIVPPSHRNNGYGRILARSYLYYAPRLGYRASVFNLVFVNNVASIKLWEQLGFAKAGLIPKAGRLKRTDGPGEEYVDAWVFYRSFVDKDRDGPPSKGPTDASGPNGPMT